MTEDTPTPPLPPLGPPPEEEAYEVSVQERPAWQNQLRAAVGLRPLPPRVVHTLRVAPPADPDAPAALVRGMWWTLAALCFAALAAGAFMVYGVRVQEQRLGAALESSDAVRMVLEKASQGDLDAARQAVTQARTRLRGDVSLDFMEGYLDAVQSSSAAAPGVPERGLRRTRLRALVTLAGYYTGRADSAASVKALQEALKLDPEDPGVGLLLAAAYVEAGQAREAIQLTGKLEDQGGTHVTLCRLRGWAYLALGEADRATAEFRAGLMLDPGSAVMYQGLAEAANARGELKDALAAAEHARRLAPGTPDPLFLMATAYQRAGDWRKAIAGFREALRLDPEHVQSLNNLAYLLSTRAGKPGEAIPLADRALKLAPQSPDIMDTAGWARYLAGDAHGAEPLLRKALQAQSQDPELALHLGVVLVALGNPREASPLLERAAADGVPEPLRAAARAALAKLRGPQG